jgi:peptidoglycan/LPS O-acetylase OafA/YrhL
MALSFLRRRFLKNFPIYFYVKLWSAILAPLLTPWGHDLNKLESTLAEHASI